MAMTEPKTEVVASGEELPVLTVRDTIIFPGAVLPITVGRPSSLALVQSLGEERTFAVISQLDPRVESPRPEDLYQTGTVCVLHKTIRVPRDNLLLFVRVRPTHLDAGFLIGGVAGERYAVVGFQLPGSNSSRALTGCSAMRWSTSHR